MEQLEIVTVLPIVIRFDITFTAPNIFHTSEHTIKYYLHTLPGYCFELGCIVSKFLENVFENM